MTTMLNLNGGNVGLNKVIPVSMSQNMFKYPSKPIQLLTLFKLVLEKAKELKIKLPTSAGSSKKLEFQKSSREFQKNIYFCFIDYAKVFDCVDHNKPWKILKEMGIPDHLTCLFRNHICRSRSNIQNWTSNNRMVPNRKRGMSRLYILTLLI